MTSSRDAQISAKTDQDLADRVNQELPIKVTAEDVKQYPHFAKLLTAIAQHITEDGSSKTVRQDHQEAKEALRQDKYQWLQNYTLHCELHEWLLDQQLEETDRASATSHIQFHQAVQDSVTQAEIVDYLDCHPNPGSSVTLLGLKKEDLQHHNPHHKHLGSIQQKLIPELEARLQKRCEILVNFHEASDSQESNKLVFGKVSQLPGMVESEMRHMEQQKNELKRDRHNRDRQFWHYYQALMDSLGILEELITKHRLHTQAQHDQVTSEWLMVRCDAMCLKIRLVELQLLCDTYHAETVHALTKIKHSLDTAVRETKEELSQVTQTLRAYQSVGMNFDSIVQEYAYLVHELENKRWALSELKRSLAQDS